MTALLQPGTWVQHGPPGNKQAGVIREVLASAYVVDFDAGGALVDDHEAFEPVPREPVEERIVRVRAEKAQETR